MRGPFRFACIFLAIIIILTFGVWFFLDFRATVELAELLDEVEASRAGMKDLTPPPIPDDENAAILYNEAFAVRRRVWMDELTPIERRSMNAVVRNGWSEEHAQNIISLIEKSSEALSLIRQASKRKACRFDIDYEKGPAMPLPHLGSLQECARLLDMEALTKQHRGDLRGAFESCATCLRMSRSVSNEPILISRLVLMATGNIGINALKRLADDERCSEEMYRSTLDEMLLLEKDDPGLKFVFEGERCLFGISIYDAVQENPSQLKNFGLPAPGSVRFLGPLASPFFKSDEVFYLTMMKESIEAIQLPYAEANRKLASIMNDVTANRWRVVAKAFTPAVGRAYEREISHQAAWRACEIGLALKIYQKQKGRLPDSLAELTPDILEALPKNPFTGEDFLYRQNEEGAGVYSEVGDGQDLWRVKRRTPDDG